MRKVILYIAASLDNFIARENGDVEWLYPGGDYGYKEFYDSIDTVVMGYKTYEKVLSFGSYEYKDKQSIVFTNKQKDALPGIQFVNGNFLQSFKMVKNGPGKTIWLCGGGEINTLFLRNKMIDEIQLFIQPIILGKGIPLFYNADETSFKVQEVKEYPTGMTKLVLIPEYSNYN